ncbi:MAG: hypothetical protein WC959_01410 [Kiritimatiellales bacterium]
MKKATTTKLKKTAPKKGVSKCAVKKTAPVRRKKKAILPPPMITMIGDRLSKIIITGNALPAVTGFLAYVSRFGSAEVTSDDGGNFRVHYDDPEIHAAIMEINDDEGRFPAEDKVWTSDEKDLLAELFFGECSINDMMEELSRPFDDILETLAAAGLITDEEFEEADLETTINDTEMAGEEREIIECDLSIPQELLLRNAA